MEPVRRLARKRIRLIALCLCMLTADLVSIHSEAASVQEDQVKAAILYKLSRFIQWPGKVRTNTLTICMLGQDPLNSYASSLKGRKSMNQTIDVRILTAFDDTAALCNLLFVNEGAGNQFEHVLKSLNNTPVLTVSDIRNFAQQGGMIELAKEGNRIAFILNLSATRTAGIVVSSQLMKLARVIR